MSAPFRFLMLRFWPTDGWEHLKQPKADLPLEWKYSPTNIYLSIGVQDKYDRYLADVWYQPTANSSQPSDAEERKLTADGFVYLNGVLLEEGLVDRME